MVMRSIRKFFRKYKIKAKKIYTVVILTILEIVMILWYTNWVFTPMIFIPLIQFVAIFENRDVWKKLSEKEKKEIILSEDELDNFVKGIVESLSDGMTIDEILEKIKKN